MKYWHLLARELESQEMKVGHIIVLEFSLTTLVSSKRPLCSIKDSYRYAVQLVMSMEKLSPTTALVLTT